MVADTSNPNSVDDTTPEADNADMGADNVTPITDAQPQESDEKAARITALEAELAAMKDKALRALAEAENTRRRAEKDREDASKYAIASFAKNLLPVADNFRRAIEAMPADLIAAHEPIKNLMAGIEATERELLRAFGTSHIEKIEPLGQIFDPNLHEVLFEVPAAGKQAGTIMQVIEVGYKIHDRILRPARVGVAKSDGTNDVHAVDTMA